MSTICDFELFYPTMEIETMKRKTTMADKNEIATDVLGQLQSTPVDYAPNRIDPQRLAELRKIHGFSEVRGGYIIDRFPGAEKYDGIYTTMEEVKAARDSVE